MEIPVNEHPTFRISPVARVARAAAGAAIFLLIRRMFEGTSLSADPVETILVAVISYTSPLFAHEVRSLSCL
jgi:hypothetical protein